jgi:hypothetical protein
LLCLQYPSFGETVWCTHRWWKHRITNAVVNNLHLPFLFSLSIIVYTVYMYKIKLYEFLMNRQDRRPRPLAHGVPVASHVSARRRMPDIVDGKPRFMPRLNYLAVVLARDRHPMRGLNDTGSTPRHRRTGTGGERSWKYSLARETSRAR